MNIDAYIFDFDGVILDTEWPEYQSIREEFARVGLDFDLATWQVCVGSAWAPDWIDQLEHDTPHAVDRASILARRRARKRELNAQLELRPGVLDRIAEAERNGLGLAVASSSPRTWVEPHLERLRLLDRFHHVFTRDDVTQAKPAPDLYIAAVRALGIPADRAVAFEDSHNGSLAAKAAGLCCVVTPNPVTLLQDFSHADLVVQSLEEIDLDGLRRLVA